MNFTILNTMRRNKILQMRIGVAAILILCSLGLSWRAPAQADVASTPSLVISQLKITSSNGQFVTLYNSTATTVNLSNYQLQYFNSFDLTKATSSRLIALTGTIPPHGYYVVNDGALTLCYQLTVDSVSLGFSSTAGMVELIAFNQTAAGGPVSASLQDYVGWSKTAASGAQTLPIASSAFLNRLPLTAQNNPQVVSPGSGNWQAVQPDATSVCGLTTVTANGGSGAVVPSNGSQLLPASEAPATIVALSSDASASAPAPNLPAADVGLMAPQITELLPNPAGTGNDATDEFIELYNANDTVFDLSGFSLQTGTTALHSYALPAGSNLPPHAFVAFYSSATGLSMSNSGGQAKLLDPFGTTVASTEVYGTAADGQAWALAKDKWYWTLTPTPNAANQIKQPPVKKTSVAAAKKTSAGSAAAATKKVALKSAAASALSDGIIPKTPIHSWVLALIVGLALLYAIYEYRTDLANHIFKLRQYLTNRRNHR